MAFVICKTLLISLGLYSAIAKDIEHGELDLEVAKFLLRLALESQRSKRYTFAAIGFPSAFATRMRSPLPQSRSGPKTSASTIAPSAGKPHKLTA